jgi:predicted transposase/invertase (TIGR01784 family)
MLKLRNYDIESLYQKPISREYTVSLKPIEEGEKATILSDTMLKTMFQNENRLKYSCKLLSYFLDMSYEDLLKNIHLAKNESDKKYENDKGERCDYVADINGSYVNIEVNNNSSLEAMERNIEYLMRLYSRKVKRGNQYQYTWSLSLNLNNFSIKGNDKIIDIYGIQNEDGVFLTDKIIIIQIYIPNLRKKWYTEGVEKLNELERYLLTLVERKVEDALEFGIGDTLMEEYVKEAKEVSEDFNFGESYDKEWALRDEGIREGIEQGIEQGINQNKLEIAKSMLKEQLSIDTIIKCTGLTKGEIEKL